MSKILRRGIQTGFIILGLLIFGAVFTGRDIFLRNYNNLSQILPIHAVFVLIMGIILWELNAGRIPVKGLLCGDQTRIDKFFSKMVNPADG